MPNKYHVFPLLCFFAVLGINQLKSQTEGAIFSAAGFGNNCSGSNSPIDPNGDCYITNSGSNFSGGGISELSEFEALATGLDLIIPWTGLNYIDSEPSADPNNGGACNNVDIVTDGLNPATHSYYTVFMDGGTQYHAFRIRIADESNGNFGFSILVDTDGKIGQFGANADINYTCGNAGFEKEVVLATGGNANNVGVSIYDTDGLGSLPNNPSKVGGTNFPNNWHVSYAEYSHAACSSRTPVFYTFFVQSSLLGFSVPVADAGLISGSSTSGGSVLSANGSDIGGLDGNGSSDPCDCANLCSAAGASCSTCLLDCQQACLSGPATPFPVEWQQISADQAPGGIAIQWVVSQEVNNDYFAVERRSGNSLFQTLDKVNGRGTANTPWTYQFFDHNQSLEDLYYRIKQVDIDGVFSYSPVVKFSKESSIASGELMYPSANTPLQLSWFSPKEALIKVHVNDIQGRQIQSLVREVPQGYSVSPISLPNLTKGIYLISVTNDDGSLAFVSKFIQQ